MIQYLTQSINGLRFFNLGNKKGSVFLLIKNIQNRLEIFFMSDK